MLTNADSSIFLNSSAVELQPMVSAEWNQNLFNSPYLTVAGTGSKETISIYGGTSEGRVSSDLAYPGFNTDSFVLVNGTKTVVWNCSTSTTSPAYKIITYVKTDSPLPAILNAHAKGTASQFGSTSLEVNSFGWTKVELYMGGANSTDNISNIQYTLTVNTLNSTTTNPTVYYTVPEVYATTFFDYQYNSLWPSDSAFSYFRPGDSYVNTGNANFSFPSNFRQVTTQKVAGSAVTTNMPVSPIIQNPNFTMASSPVPILKNALANDMSAYKYFVSDTTSQSITGMYAQNISANKLVFKFNTIMTTPTFNLYIDDAIVTVDGSTALVPDSTGVLVLYWNGSAWTKTKWSTMPKFNSTGGLTINNQFKKIRVTQISKTVKSAFTSYTNSYLTSDLARMQLVEISPRLEIDLTDFVKELDINKSLDSKNNFVPISSINTDDATINLSAIPLTSGTSLIPIFSSQSNLSTNVLANMLRKNIKFYINFNLKSYFNNSTNSLVEVNSSTGTIIPGGIFYSDAWDETDIKDVKITAFDRTRYLQTAPVPDYVANLKTVFDVISNILDLAGFTDYDYDSLYNVCNDPALPLDLAYYYCNSKDTTVIDALSQIFLAYQIGAFMNEYGVMTFKSLSGILSSSASTMTISDSSIIESGYSITNKAKPGKISLRYQAPKIKQSLSLQNAKNVAIQDSPSFIYTTSNDVTWSQGNLDSVGFNYLNANMTETSSNFNINVNSLLDIFHTFSMNNDGYAVIENEIVTFVYKEYIIRKFSDQSNPVTFSVKNDLELAANVNRYIKDYSSSLILSDGSTKADYDIEIVPTGNITNVQRGMFGTVPAKHEVISSVTGTGTGGKDLVVATTGSNYSMSNGVSGVASIVNNTDSNPDNPLVTKIQLVPPVGYKALIYPNSQSDNSYKTYSTKFDFMNSASSAAGVFFNVPNSYSAEGGYFVELQRFSEAAVSPTVSGQKGSNVVTVSSTDGISLNMNISGTGIVPGTTVVGITPAGLTTSGSTSASLTLSSLNNASVSGSAIIGSYKYVLVVYQIVSGQENILAWSDVTGIAGSIIDNFEKVLVKVNTTNSYFYNTASDEAFHLKAVHYTSNGDDGETAGEKLSVFLNNVEINNWQVLGQISPTSAYAWTSLGLNQLTMRRLKISLPTAVSTGSKFGFFTSNNPVELDTFYYPTISSSVASTNLREIYATQKPLKERSVNYWYQDRQFLNGLIQGQNLYSSSQTYVMQTNPEIVGINTYDVQYTNPAAVTVDVLPIEYLWYYFPGTQPTDQKYYNKQLVDEYSLSYSTPINTGFRAKMAIVNNSNHMVYTKHDSTGTNSFTVNLNLWTHEIIAPSDAAIIEKIVDRSNATEVAQVDSPWIQSDLAANRMLSVIEKGFEGFSRDTTIQMFGNPLIQVGDVITLNYNLSKINQQKYTVHSVSHVYNQGLKTTLVLNQIDKGSTY